MAPNPTSPAQFGPDFRYGCPQNTPGAWKGRQEAKNQETLGKSGGQKSWLSTQIRSFCLQISGYPI